MKRQRERGMAANLETDSEMLPVPLTEVQDSISLTADSGNDEVVTSNADSSTPNKTSDNNTETGTAGTSETGDHVAAGLRESDRYFLMVVCTVILLLIGVHLIRMSWRGTPLIEVVRQPQHALEFQIDINQATWVEWMQLPEIGEVTARRIVEDRTAHGAFRSPEDVIRVKGIGKATMEKIRPHLKSISTAP